LIPILLAAIWVIVGVMHYDVARRTDMPRHEQLKYSIAWPWLYIAWVGYTIWNLVFPED
jgi:hypothetical protein